ncbi:MAG: zinc ribbon domain-containing protein [Pseudoclavibacter sp.]|nr:zinc ribbon domain-containing protein [Pseudoclavibacter sp.]
MPTYSYRCPQCGDAFDIQQSFSDAALTACGRCGGALRKVFSPVGIAFKGSGFYRTDSAAPRKEGSPKTSEGSEKGKGSAGDGGSASPTTQGAAKPAPAKSGD